MSMTTALTTPDPSFDPTQPVADTLALIRAELSACRPHRSFNDVQPSAAENRLPVMSYEQAAELLRYNPETGKLYWLPRPVEAFRNAGAATTFNRHHANQEAFIHVGSDGYMRGRVWYRAYLAHRVAWLLHYGEWPDVIDHLNGERADNRIANLRSVTAAGNSLNLAVRSDSRSGVAGVTWASFHGKWCAYIRKGGRRTILGHFDTIEGAAEARRAAEVALGFTENDRRGNPACCSHSPVASPRRSVGGGRRLSEDIVRQIRGMAATGFSTADIARQFSLTHTGAARVIKRKTWRHVT
jgi:hypothetical protein